MPLINDVNTARRIVRDLLLSRRNRKAIERRADELARPESTPAEVVVYFADTRVNLYQIRQWYGPLAELSKTRRVAIITRSPGTALTLLDESPVPVLYLRAVVDLEGFVAAQEVKLALYVNQNAKNFQMFRYHRMWHVFVNHGESDKMYMTTNQFKAYDYSFVAGEAARDRLRRKLWDFDVDGRTMMIGRPQADHFAGQLPYTPDARTVVLYSPTWEGDREAAAYGSVVTHGRALTAALLASGRHRLIYRPHPRSGVIDAEFRAANEAIIASISAANAADPSAHHVYDDGPDLGWQLAAADMAITDISAMVYDRLATGRPLLITRPASSSADVDSTGYLGAAEWLDAADAPDVIAAIDAVIDNPDARQRLGYWARRHFGDTAAGAATAAFHEAVETLVERWHEQAALHENDAPDRESSPFDDDTDEDDAPN